MTFRAGSATHDITPDSPVPMSGYGARDGFSTGVHDPLSAKALVLSDGATTVGIVAADLLNVSRELSIRVRRRLSAAGIHLDELVLTATHTHAGPYVPAPVIDRDPLLAVEADVSETVREIENGVVGSVTDAHGVLESATMSVGRAVNTNVPINRRAAGGVGGNVRMPHGPVDPTVTALVVTTESGTETVLFNFACHPVCTTPGETLLSADWPGYACAHVAAETGAERVLFVNGAAGDINPRDSSEPREGEEVYSYMEDVGTSVGETVVRARARAKESDAIVTPRLLADRRELRLPLKSVPPREEIVARLADLGSEIERLEADGNDDAIASRRWNQRYVQSLRGIADWDAKRLPASMGYVEIGPVGILGMPGEILLEHGRRFASRATAETLVLAGYADGYVGYVPTLAELENIGYEVRMAKIAPEAILEFRDAGFDLVS
ncbi:neutral/alkaline non-lysosomal ceramidase N-terminal domain-containing protein [Haladaptatus sp. DYF46]|uniref:neutral/alkaline non-lysosomal ceramidase N-terminal domain-containing protein n=1 Tax=Haladaptatus sp. DYF46 TaxID=2886041 RepID=UPI001E3D7661|nr:neutral/alkaline non-lysosomal ceramidase N-terminal domain-containing protein [Haladaptatus sp. DYF46]